MASAAQFRIEHVAAKPRGWKVRTKLEGAHRLRVAFPPGPRKTGSGQVLEILHPKGERNPECKLAGKNPAELVIFGNPSKHRLLVTRVGRKKNSDGAPNHKPGCTCPICKNVRKAKGRIGKKAVEKTENPKHRRRRRRNSPEETQQAVQLYEAFHGRDPRGMIERQASDKIRMQYTALGDLEYLLVESVEGKPVKIDFEGDRVKLASSPDGSTLYCIGGNQNLEDLLEKFGVDASKDFVELGRAVEVQYFAHKAQANFQPVSYYHKFGEESGAQPAVIFDRLKKQVFFVGGEYRIEAPGIIN